MTPSKERKKNLVDGSVVGTGSRASTRGLRRVMNAKDGSCSREYVRDGIMKKLSYTIFAALLQHACSIAACLTSTGITDMAVR